MKRRLIRGWRPLFLFALLLFCSNTCAKGGSTGPVWQERPIQYSMGQCTAKYGYNPNMTQNLGEHELGQGEEQWHACVQEEIRKRVAGPSGTVPKEYAEYIEQDQRWTAAVKSGEMTRSERDRRIETLREAVRREEAAMLAAQRRNEDEVMLQRTETQMRLGYGFRTQPQDNALESLYRGIP